MSQQWRGAPKPTGWETYSYSRNRVSDDRVLTTLGSSPCWCQGDICEPGPDGKPWWPGKDEGAPHPRERSDVTAASKDARREARRAEEEVLKHEQIKKFKGEMRDVILTLVNKYGVQYRLQADGQHIFLYSGDRNSRPHKIAAARPFQRQMQMTLPWLRDNFPDIDLESGKKKERSVEAIFKCTRGCKDVSFTSIDDINDHYAKEHVEAQRPAVLPPSTQRGEQDRRPVPTPPKQRPVETAPILDEDDGDHTDRRLGTEIEEDEPVVVNADRFEEIEAREPVPGDTDGWHYFKYSNGSTSVCIQQKGEEKVYRCTWEGCGYTHEGKATGLYFHEAGHTGQRERDLVNAVQTREETRERKKRERLDALNVLAERDGFVVFDKDEAARLKQSKTLSDENARLQERVDELETKMALAKEAFGL